MSDSLLETRFRNFPVPALDDRQFDDLMEELLALIPVYCPEWTWHSPADPGITLLELFAYLTDVMLYRINYMPVKNLFAVLNLLGIQPLPPACARTQLVIEPTAAAHGQVLRAGTAITAQAGAPMPADPFETQDGALPDAAFRASDPTPEDDSEPLTFETESDLLLSNAQLIHLITSSGQSTRDLSAWLESRAEPVAPFGGIQGLERFLYFCDTRFLTLREPGMRVHLRFEGPSGHRDLYARWLWQYFDGESWERMPLAVSHEAGEVVFITTPTLAELTMQGHNGPWLRAIPLLGEEAPDQIAFRDIQVEVESIDEGVLPTALFVNTGDLFASLDVTRTFYPLGEQPKRDTCLYLLARELFRAGGTRIELHWVAPAGERGARPDPSPDLELALEYGLPGGRWGLLRTLTPNPFTHSGDPLHAVSDDTRALKRGGVLAFQVPEDLTSRQIQGLEGPWIRLRLVQGQYRRPLESQEDPQTLDPTAIPGLRPFTGAEEPPPGPLFQSLLLRSRAPASPLQQCLSFSDFSWMPLWNAQQPRGTSVTPFPLREAYATALYLGFSQPFPPGNQRLWIKVASDGDAYSGPNDARLCFQRVRWEVSTPHGFVPLPQLSDQTLHLKRDGYVSFQAQAEWGATELFERPALWIRARLEAGQYDQAPLLLDVRTNVVDVQHGETWREDRYVASDGQPYQEIQLAQTPVLDPVVIWVREREPLRSAEARRALVASLGTQSLREDEAGVYTRWRRTEQLGLADPQDRCFALDPHQGILRFGDGRHGRVPPAGPRSIHILSYRTGGGARGNVAAHTLQTLRESHAWVASVDNPYPADGGAEAESLTDAATRGTRRMFQVERAYRAEDYELLARQASGGVARAHCLPPRARELPLTRHAGEAMRQSSTLEGAGGSIHAGPLDAGPLEVEPLRIIVLPRRWTAPPGVPAVDSSSGVSRPQPTLGQRWFPSQELLERVRCFLNDRRTLNVQLEVTGPRYVPFSIRASLYLRGRMSPGTEEDLQQRLRRYLHPLSGGEAGQGWPLGGPVRRPGLFQVLAACPQVLSVLDVQLFDRHGEPIEGTLHLEDDQLPLLTRMQVEVATLR